MIANRTDPWQAPVRLSDKPRDVSKACRGGLSETNHQELLAGFRRFTTIRPHAWFPLRWQQIVL
jgi:hypothetical protein